MTTSRTEQNSPSEQNSSSAELSPQEPCLQTPLQARVAEIQACIAEKLLRVFGRTLEKATPDQLYKVVSLCIRDEIMLRWQEGNAEVERQHLKRLYYLSAEFLMGRAMMNNIYNLEEYEAYTQALQGLGLDLAEIEQQESDAGLGNGGLGRLAACFLDSLSTLNLPVVGCGIRYEYGLFRQRILEGEQVEVPDNWTDKGYVWEIERAEERYEVHFDGEVEEVWTEDGLKIYHRNAHTVYAIPYDMPILGYQTKLPATLRLWSARAANRLDLSYFNRGEYVRSMAEKELAEVISKVLYPENNHEQGKQLRLKQFYFLASASMQSMVNYHKRHYGDLHSLPEHVCVQINDTHPTLAIPELMRILLDEEGFSWEDAWDVTTRVFHYTNHTVMAEALESWELTMFQKLLPRIYRIIETINEQFCQKMWQIYPGDFQKISDMAILAYDEVRMANLCIAASRRVNGVSQLHARILKTKTFRDFYIAQPDKFCGITNGITQRRWLQVANPALASLLREVTDGDFLADWRCFSQIENYAGDAAFAERYAAVKAENKRRFADYVLEKQGQKLDPESIFDVHAKRLHEYKRQLLKVLHILSLYNRIAAGELFDGPPITFIFAAKAPPGYARAKTIIRLINSVAQLVNEDPRCQGKIAVLFLENYGVSAAQLLIPAADISEQISTAGREASGTGNMKFMMNGALTLGTMDGANVEMYERLEGRDIYIFGARMEELSGLEQYGTYHPGEYFEKNPTLRAALSRLIDSSLPVASGQQFSDIYQSLLFGEYQKADQYYLLYDFASYEQTYRQIWQDYCDQQEWTRMAIRNTARSGYFSADRTIRDYNEHIWGLTALTEAVR